MKAYPAKYYLKTCQAKSEEIIKYFLEYKQSGKDHWFFGKDALYAGNKVVYHVHIKPDALNNFPETKIECEKWEKFDDLNTKKTGSVVLLYATNGRREFLLINVYEIGHLKAVYDKVKNKYTKLAEDWIHNGDYPGKGEPLAKIDQVKRDVPVTIKKKKTIVKESKFLTFKQWLFSRFQ